MISILKTVNNELFGYLTPGFVKNIFEKVFEHVYFYKTAYNRPNYFTFFNPKDR